MELVCPHCGRSDFKNVQARSGHLAHCSRAARTPQAAALLRGHADAIEGVTRHGRLASRWRLWMFLWTLVAVAVVGVTAGVAGAALVGLAPSLAAQIAATTAAPLVLIGFGLGRWAATRYDYHARVAQAFLQARDEFEACRAGTSVADEALCTLRAATTLETLLV